MRELRIGVRKVQPVLVVCHSSVLCNWKEELNTWDTSLWSDREDSVRNGSREVVLITFDTARLHIEELDLVDLRVVVVDECHKIKEMNLHAMKCSMRIGMNGTAVQTKYEELWCLLDWANPGCLR